MKCHYIFCALYAAASALPFSNAVLHFGAGTTLENYAMGGMMLIFSFDCYRRAKKGAA